MSRRWRAAIAFLFAAAVACGEGDTRSQAVAPPLASPICVHEPGAPRQMVKECGEIASSGCFVLGADLVSNRSGAACLSLHDAANVDLDCAGHAISVVPAIAVKNVSGFRIHGCKITNERLFVVDIVGSRDGLIDHNDVRGGIHAADSDRLTLSSNELGSMYFQEYGRSSIVQDNIFALPPDPTGAIASPIYLRYGSSTQVLRNRVDGGWDGQHQAGADDGIVLEDEHGDRLEGNSFSNVYDCGVETLGLLADSVISNNVVQNAGICGIGGWYWNSWRGNRVTGNAVDASLQLFLFNRYGGLRPAGFDPEKKMPADAAIEFHDNVFEQNSFTNPQSTLPSSSIPVYAGMLYTPSTVFFPPVPGSREPGPGDFQLLNNVFRGNRFGTGTPAPAFGDAVVPGAVVDGGGNVCAVPPQHPYPLACSDER